jgi:hypothetical protein
MNSLRTLRFKHHDENPPPGEPGHDHWGSERPVTVSHDVWRAYGDRYPGSVCRWLTDTPAGQRGLVRRREQRERERRQQNANALWLRVQTSWEAVQRLTGQVSA